MFSDHHCCLPVCSSRVGGREHRPDQAAAREFPRSWERPFPDQHRRRAGRRPGSGDWRGRPRCAGRPAQPCRDHGTGRCGPCSITTTRTNVPAPRSREFAFTAPWGRRRRTRRRGCPGAAGGRGTHRSPIPAVPPGPRAPLGAAPFRPRGLALPSGLPLGLSTYLGVELSPFQGCPLAAKLSSALSGTRPLGAPAPCSPAPHRLSAEAPRRPLACGVERRGRETPPPPPGAARSPAAKGAAAVAKGAVSGSAESGGRAGPARGRGYA